MDNEIRAEFFRRTLRRSFEEILRRQQGIASDRGQHSLAERLAAMQPKVEVSGGRLEAELDYPLRTRFVDMRHLQNLRIYNRPLWQAVYADVVPELRHGFTDDVRRELRSQLQRLFPEHTG